MDIFTECLIWHENGEFQKIIDALEGIPANARAPEEASELASAYSNLAGPGDREMYLKALSLLKPHADYFEDDHDWHFRMGYAYYYLDQAGRALSHFRKALEACPGDEETLEFIESCEKCIALPQFKACFRERTTNCWESFARIEAELRKRMYEDEDHAHTTDILAQMEGILNLAFDEVSFEMGFNGEKPVLILSPMGDRAHLFELVYFRNHAPEKVLANWDILVGRQPVQNIALRTNTGWRISGDEVQIWLEDTGNNRFAISAYCEKLIPVLENSESRAAWLLSILTDKALGEIPHMRYIESLNLLKKRKKKRPMLMSQLCDKLREKGLDLSTDPEVFLETRRGYQMEPNEDRDADWRLDVICGSTSCAALINGYLINDNDSVDDLHADGAVAGFLCYPLDTLMEEEGGQRLYDFRDRLEESLAAGDGPDVLTLTGGATGLYFDYVDFIAWDIRAALEKASAFFEDSDIPWASFHTFRREAGGLLLKQREPVTGD